MSFDLPENSHYCENTKDVVLCPQSACSCGSEETREEKATRLIKESGKTAHASDCATSCAPAEEPGPCDCTYGEEEYQIQLVLVKRTGTALKGFHFEELSRTDPLVDGSEAREQFKALDILGHALLPLSR